MKRKKGKKLSSNVAEITQGAYDLGYDSMAAYQEGFEAARAELKPIIKAVPKIDEVELIGRLDRVLSELKYVIDNPELFDICTFQTVKHHIEDLDMFVAYAKVKLRRSQSTPMAATEQAERGY